MHSLASQPATSLGNSLAFSIGVVQRSFVWTVIVAASAVGLVISGGVNAETPSTEGSMNTMLAQAEGK
jgi:hypothetical protein